MRVDGTFDSRQSHSVLLPIHRFWRISPVVCLTVVRIKDGDTEATRCMFGLHEQVIHAHGIANH